MAELESEGTKTRGGVADFLREFADELDDAEDEHVPVEGDEGEAMHANRITLIVGGDSATVTVPEEVEFDVEVDSRSPMLSSGVRQEIEFSLSWEVDDPEEHTDELIQIE